MYAGSEFRTQASQENLRTDNSKVRYEYLARDTNGRERRWKAYGVIQRIFKHEMYPGGPVICLLECNWYPRVDLDAKSFNILVGSQPAPGADGDRFVNVQNCYQLPIVLWPHDPLGLCSIDDPRRDLLEVIDRNQDEVPGDAEHE